MILKVNPDGELLAGDKKYHCALGKSGVKNNKKEGDGATPAGCFPVRKVYFRKDRVQKIETKLPLIPLSPDDGWCDDPNDPKYNQFVKLPYSASSESLWREDNIYDVTAVLGYNDDPPVPGKGSAIFMHVARKNYSPTEGCVALALPDLLEILKILGSNDKICVVN